MPPQPQLLTEEELKHLADIREVNNTISSAGWMLIVKQIEKFAEEAHEDMVGVPAQASDRTKANLLLRWQQREAMLRGIKQYAQSCEDEKLTLLQQLERSSGEENAERSEDVGGWQTLGETGDGRGF